MAMVTMMAMVIMMAVVMVAVVMVVVVRSVTNSTADHPSDNSTTYASGCMMAVVVWVAIIVVRALDDHYRSRLEHDRLLDLDSHWRSHDWLRVGNLLHSWLLLHHDWLCAHHWLLSLSPGKRHLLVVIVYLWLLRGSCRR